MGGMGSAAGQMMTCPSCRKPRDPVDRYHQVFVSVPEWRNVLNRALALAAPAWRLAEKSGHRLARRIVVIPIVVVVVVGGAIAATFGLHALLVRSGSTDAWAAAIGAVSTVVLVLITGWYAFLTFGLLQAQRSSARTASWETALRDLAIFVGRRNEVFWAVARYFPVNTDAAPPDMAEVFKSRDALGEIQNHLTEIFALLPEDFAHLTLITTGYLLMAGRELNALGLAMLEEAQAGIAEGRQHWTWRGAQERHEARDAEDRQEPWTDVLAGMWFSQAEQGWEKMSEELDEELRGL